MIVEVCIDSVESALAAQQGGASRVELCAELDKGGITPSAGTIEQVCRSIRIGVHVMIRPRPGDFCYSDHEFAVMQKDIQVARQLGAHGAVFGVLTRDRTVDVPRTKALVELARPMSISFHRAFDESVNLDTAMEAIIGLGIDRILTSGGRPSALEGMGKIKELVQRSNGRIAIMAGAGITLENASAIIAWTGVDEIHVRSAVTRVAGNAPRNGSLFALPRAVVDPQAVKSYLNVVQRG
ncbi:MAG: copper homeostasis protein CutC [Ignavibacteria bacterium]|nr:copper homeostasis protein CutC [Ignavibacteria bacterium]